MSDSDSEGRSSSPNEGRALSTGGSADHTKITGASETERHTAVEPSSASVGSSIRERRKIKLSAAGKESKISELCLNIGKRINIEFKCLTDTQKSVSSGITLSDLYDTYDTVDNKRKCVVELYQEIVTLCDNDANKVPEQTNKMYVLFVSRVDEFCSSMEQQMDEQEILEQESTERDKQERARQLAEEERLFQEYVSESNNVGPIRVLRDSTPLPADDTPLVVSSGQNTETTQHPPPQETKPSTSKFPTETSVLNTLLKGFTEALAVGNKKSVEPEVFRGEVLKFSDWEVDLEAYLQAEKIVGNHRMRHMKRFVDGEARKSIESHLAINTETAYEEARAVLKERYGNEHAIARNFHKKLNDWPQIKPRDAKGLQEFSDYLCYLQTAMSSMPQLDILNNCIENERMAAKLPDWLRLRWPRVVGQKRKSEQRYPTFSEFSEFVQDEAYIANLEISTGMAQEKRQDKRQEKKNITTFQTSVEAKSIQCGFCSLKNHPTSDCYKLQKVNKEERDKIIKEMGLCFRCLETGHRSKGCVDKKDCLICKKPHATANHDNNWSPKNQTEKKAAQLKKDTATQNSKENTNQPKQTAATPGQQQPKELGCRATRMQGNMTSMLVPVYLSAGTGREILVYAMLDNMSDACYVSAEVVKMLNANADDIEKNVVIHTVNGSECTDIERYDNLMLRGYSTDNYAQISAYKKDQVYCKRDQIPNPDRAKRLAHLKTIAEAIPPPLDIPIGLLIGCDHPEVIQPLESRPAPKLSVGLPFAVRTLFGWTMAGGSNNCSGVNKQVYKTEKSTELMSILEQDFRDTNTDSALISQDDLMFQQILENSTKQNANGNYIMPLPFKRPEKEINLPFNRAQAEKRFVGVVKKFRADPAYHEEYRNFIEDLIKNGHAEKAPDTAEPGKVWYLPHFAVRHKQKKKLRVVIDASARFNGTSLNDLLLTGPDHMNSLIGILLRFRKEPVAVTSDIQKMFYNFVVKQEHRDYLRFLWVDEQLQQVTDYRMTVHLFGATSSPAVATFGLRKLADDHKDISHDAAEFLKNDFYVDDGVTSVATKEKAKSLIQEATEICNKGNVRLHKFLSNHKEVLVSVPKSERSESIKTLDLFRDLLPHERTLGMEWCVENDIFTFSTPDVSKPHTRRGLLSTLAQVYDPLGLVSPVILKGKQILQKVTFKEASWDQLLSPEESEEWATWQEDLKHIHQIQVSRCIKPVSDWKSVELHHFSDASQNGYGACSYIRYVKADGGAESKLLLAKARVAPIKKITTIPRLELQAAVTATRLARVLRKELKMEINQEYFWTDSNIVLGYIQNDAKRFHVYVANRVAEIKQTTKSEQWNHVASEDNPADMVSRGCSVEEIKKNKIWLQGPNFLNEAELSTYVRSNQEDIDLDPKDPELKRLVTHTTTMSRDFSRKFEKFSGWHKLVKSIAILRACIKQKRKTGITWRTPTLTVDDLTEAEEFIIRTTQRAAYPDKEKERTLTGLNPIIDDRGLIRLGGRVDKASSWSYSQRHPTIIPKTSLIAKLIVRAHHERIYHLGYRSTLGAVREAGYWIVNGSGIVKACINLCTHCKKLRAKPNNQQMGELPEERLERTAPFTHIGMDVFGPFHVKDRRTEAKRWGLVMSCLYSRAIHIEVLEEMTTDCLILALRCFLAIRGPVQTIICDNGTNFVGMANELSRQLDLANPSLSNYLLSNKIAMVFNPPKASHQGGATERMIRSIRAVLNGMNFKHRVDTKTLRTVFHEIANIVNNRPLTGTKISDPREHVATPNQLLTMKSPLLAPPPGQFPASDLYCNKRWKVSQAIADEFWRAWKTEYIATVSTRPKWIKKKENLKIGDIVMVVDDGAPRSDWRVGAVSSVYPGKDGLVRQVDVTLGNRHLDSKGKPLESSTTLKRPVNKVVLLLDG